MTTFNTGNPIGSAAAKDLYDNAENLDEFVNSQDKTEHPDRLGVPRKTWHGIEEDFQSFLQLSGYQDLGDYAPGIEITARNQIIRADGEFWRLSASTDLPYTTDGSGMPEGGAFVSVGDAVLRQDLADPGMGAAMVAYGNRTVQEVLDEEILGVDATQYLPVPHATDGSVDYTDEIQAAINDNRHLRMPPFPISVRAPGLTIPSNTTVTWPEGAETRLLPNDFTNYGIVSLTDVQNIELIDPVLVGDKDQHLGTTGEWGMGLEIRSSSHVRVYSLDVRDCWGDGIYIGRRSGYLPPMPDSQWNNIDIRFYGVTRVRNCRRQGLSIITARSLSFQTLDIADIGGTPPQDGVDIEPNFPYETFSDVVIEELITRRCVGAGLHFDLRQLNSSSEPVDVTVNRHISEDTGQHFSAIVSSPEHNIGGLITVRGARYFRSRGQGIVIRRWGRMSPMLRFDNPVVADPNGTGTIYASDGAHIAAFFYASESDAYDLGNIHIADPVLIRSEGHSSPISTDIFLQSGTNRVEGVEIVRAKSDSTNLLSLGASNVLGPSSRVTRYETPVEAKVFRNAASVCIRHPDGTQECWLETPRDVDVSSDIGGIYRGGSLEWWFPVEFAGGIDFVTSSVVASDGSPSAWGGGARIAGTIAAQLFAFAPSAVGVVAVSGYARGRWK